MRRKTNAIFVLFLASGFGGLIYEAVWTHYIKLFLGHAAYAQTLVLVVFIGGLALGAWLCARFTERLQNPLRVYAMVELVIGLASLVFHQVFVSTTDWGYASLLPAACDQARSFCLPQWLLSALLLLPQSVLLGATFPLVTAAALRIDSSQPGHDVAALYFLNSLGAVFGVLAAAFVLIPEFGLPGTLRFVACVNLLLALGAFLMSRVPPPALALAPAPAGAPDVEAWDPRWLWLLMLTAFLTGLSSFMYEIAWIRMLSLVLGASTHSFELMLASFILGLALGGAWVRNRVDRVGDSLRFLAVVQLAMGVAAAATIPVFNGTFDLMAWMMSSLARNDAGFLLFSLSSSAISLLVMLPATFCAGMTLPLITYRLIRSPSGERAIGMVYAVNTLGSIVGVVIAVHVLLQWVGVRGTVLIGALVDVALGVMLLLMIRPRAASARRFPIEALVGVAAFALLAFAFDIDPRRYASGVFRSGTPTLGQNHNIVFHRDGKTATVDLVETSPGGTLSIRTNGKPDASINMIAGKPATLDEFTMTLLAALPMGHRPDATTAAVIGFGSGMSTATLLASPKIERVDTIEIEPAMVEAAQRFRPVVEAAFADPRSRIVIDDAKSFFARGHARYDIIVSEPSNPWVSGVSSLFTQEFYARLANYMSDGGVLAQWLHTYEMDAETLASILGAVSKTFPEYALYSSIDFDLILIARKGGPPGRFDEEVLKLPALQPMLTKLKLTDPLSVQRRFVAGSDAMGRLFGTYRMPSNSDYFPFVDQRSSKTRFTRARVAEIMDLQSSAVPMLEMLGGAPPPSERRIDVILSTYVDAATKQAWDLYDTMLPGAAAAGGEARSSTHELSAEVVRFWSGCSSGLAFAQALPAMATIAEGSTSRLPPQAASAIWRSLANSPCGRRLAPNEALWLEMFNATANRDSKSMLATSTAILDASKGQKTPPSELAFLTAVTAAICQRNFPTARTLLETGADHWVRPGVHLVELRFLKGMLSVAGDPRPQACSG